MSESLGLTDDAKTFYERFGFHASPLEPMTLMMTIDEVRRAIVLVDKS